MYCSRFGCGGELKTMGGVHNDVDNLNLNPKENFRLSIRKKTSEHFIEIMNVTLFECTIKSLGCL